MPKVSIIMGAYNCANTVSKCIDSIIAQTFVDWEFIICDDCSSDNTYEVLCEYQKKDSRITVLQNKQNCRLAATLNNCLAVARGKYIARADADDWCADTRLEKQVDFLDAHEEYAVVGSARYMLDEGGIYGISCSVEKPIRDNIVMGTPFAHPTIMMRKEAYDALGGYISSKKTMRAEDLNLWFRFYQKKYIGYNLQEPLYYYHESLDDYKKRTLKAAIGTAGVIKDGIDILGWSKSKYIFCLKPIIASLIPNRIMYRYHRKSHKRLEEQ